MYLLIINLILPITNYFTRIYIRVTHKSTPEIEERASWFESISMRAVKMAARLSSLSRDDSSSYKVAREGTTHRLET